MAKQGNAISQIFSYHDKFSLYVYDHEWEKKNPYIWREKKNYCPTPLLNKDNF